MDSLERYGKLVQSARNGTYCLMFLNNWALDVEEIRNIFSQFGEVFSVNVSGSDTGYRFIRYSNPKDVENAIEGLKDNPKISLCEFKEKAENKTPPKPVNDVNCFRDHYFLNSKYKRNEINGFRSYQIDNFNNKEEKSMQYKETEDNGNSVNYANGTKDQHDGNAIDQIKDEAVNVDTKDKSILDHLTEASTKFLQKNDSDDKDDPEAISNKTTKDDHDKSDLVLSKDNNVSSEEGSAINEVSTKEVLSDTKSNCEAIPDLITTKGKVITGKKHQTIEIYNAAEVIVGNIHPDYSPSYILHLFDKFEPIAISNVTREAKSGIQYCYVYFKNVQDAYTVEYLFDRTPLSGQKLIVLRPCKLLEDTQS